MIPASNTSKSVGKQEAKRNANKNAGRKQVGTKLHDWFIAIFGVAFLLSFTLNAMHLMGGSVDTNVGGKGHLSKKHAAREALHSAMKGFKKESSKNSATKQRGKSKQEKIGTGGGGLGGGQSNVGGNEPKSSKSDNSHLMELATLDCKAYGGPSPDAAQEMVYWQDIPSDSSYAPPFFEINKQQGKGKKYMTFEPDGGGWNNIRMAMESTIAVAVAMGRTLVMPPQKKMYLLGKNNGGQRHHFSFVDFFPIAEMAEDNKAFEVVSMKEYLEEEAMKGNLVNRVCHSLIKIALHCAVLNSELPFFVECL